MRVSTIWLNEFAAAALADDAEVSDPSASARQTMNRMIDDSPQNVNEALRPKYLALSRAGFQLMALPPAGRLMCESRPRVSA